MQSASYLIVLILFLHDLQLRTWSPLSEEVEDEDKVEVLAGEDMVNPVKLMGISNRHNQKRERWWEGLFPSAKSFGMMGMSRSEPHLGGPVASSGEHR